MNLIVPLILGFLSSGHSYTNPIPECYEMCPAGYHRTTKCNGSQNYKCEICHAKTFTAKENTIEKCHRCGQCKRNEVELKPCTFNRDVECDCKEGYYYTVDYRECQQCEQGEVDDTNPDYRRKCCNRCLNGTKCNKKCPAEAVVSLATSTSTTMLTKLLTTTARDTRTNRSNNTFDPIIGPVPTKGIVIKTLTGVHIIWVVLLVVVLVLFFGPLLMKIALDSKGTCHCWTVKKNVAQHPGNPIFNEQHSHQGNSSTTVTIDICEENPMMTLAQSSSTSEHPAHMCPLLPNTEHKAAKQEHSKHLPAFVHYEIIKEVPLRRWKEFLRLLSVDDKQLDRAELEAGLGVGSMERQYQMLRLWSQQSSASLNDVFAALHYMDLSGCAQKLQENLEKLQWWAESKQTFTACENHTDQDFSGALQDT